MRVKSDPSVPRAEVCNLWSSAKTLVGLSLFVFEGNSRCLYFPTDFHFFTAALAAPLAREQAKKSEAGVLKKLKDRAF